MEIRLLYVICRLLIILIHAVLFASGRGYEEFDGRLLDDLETLEGSVRTRTI